MDDMQVYIANLGKYNEGELVGAWFTFPIDFEEVKEKILKKNQDTKIRHWLAHDTYFSLF